MTYFACRNMMSDTMSHGASAEHAEASFTCAHSADTSIIAMMDAIFMASIIICALLAVLLVVVSILGLAISLLAILLVLVITNELWVQRRA